MITLHDEKPQCGSYDNNSATMILDNVVEGYWNWDMRNDRAFLSPGYCELLGYPAETIFTSSHFLNSIHPDDLAEVSRVFREYLDGKRSCSLLEFRMARKDGAYIWLRERAKVVAYEADGKPAGMVGSVIDLSTSKQIELELQNSKESLCAAQRQAHLGSWTWDVAKDMVEWSEELYRIFGLEPGQPAPSYAEHSRFYTAESLDRLNMCIQQIMATGTPFELDIELVRADGSHRHCFARVEVERRENGTIARLYGTFHDITELRLLGRELADSEELYRRVFEVESDAIFLVSRSTGKFIDANKAATDIYGYRRDELIGMDFTTLSAEPDQSRHVVDIGKTHVPLRWHRRKDGTLFPVKISASYFDFQGDSVHVAAIRDISELVQADNFREEVLAFLEHQVQERTASLTAANERLTREIEERKRTEAELLDHQQRLEALSLELSIAEERERGRIAGELHDQVGQCLILAKIKANSLAATDLLPDQRETVEGLEQLLENTINDIRSLTFQLRPPILVTAGLEAAVQWLAEELKEHYSLSVAICDDHQPKPLSYELRSCLFQAVRELLLNVTKHAGTNRVLVTFERHGDSIAITVADEGIGFEPAEVMTRTERSGGFGLFNLRQRVQYLGGRFTMESSPEQGSRATIIAPLTTETSAVNS